MEEKLVIVSVVSAFSEIFFDNSMVSLKRRLHNSSDDDEELAVFANIMHTPKRRRKIEAKVDGYVERVVPLYSFDNFKSHFRLSRSSIEHLMQMMPVDSVRKTKPKGMTREKSVLLSLWLLGNQESFRRVSSRFGIGKGHAHRVFVNFCGVLVTLAKDAICWPVGKDCVSTVSDFNVLCGQHSFPGVLGCIDGTHISCTIRKDEKTAHYNRKNFTSVILQAVCNSKLQFTDVFVDWPGSSNGARLYQRNSPYVIPDDCHLLGDNTYPLSKFLLTPYRDNGHLTEVQKYYNKVLNSTWVVIEQAFSHLFGRFRRINHLHVFRRDLLPDVIIAACVLHNLCIRFNDNTPEVHFREENHFHIDAQNAEEFVDGIAKRSRIARMVYAQRQH